MTEVAAQNAELASPGTRGDLEVRLKRAGEAIVVPLIALVAQGAFATWFSLQNTLQRAAPLLLTALCCAIPARLGLVVIGGEGALALGGLAAAVTGIAVQAAPPAL